MLKKEPWESYGRQAYFAVQKIWTLDWQRVGASQNKIPRERLILSFPVAFIMAAAMNVPLGRAKQTKKKTNVGMERGSQVDKREKIR